MNIIGRYAGRIGAEFASEQPLGNIGKLRGGVNAWKQSVFPDSPVLPA